MCDDDYEEEMRFIVRERPGKRYNCTLTDRSQTGLPPRETTCTMYRHQIFNILGDLGHLDPVNEVET